MSHLGGPRGIFVPFCSCKQLVDYSGAFSVLFELELAQPAHYAQVGLFDYSRKIQTEALPTRLADR